MKCRIKWPRIKLRNAILISLIAIVVGVASVPLFSVLVVFKYQIKQLKAVTEDTVQDLVGESKNLMGYLAEQVITEKARDVSKQIQLYIHSGGKPTHLEPNFTALAVQEVGKTGYTAVYRCTDGVVLAHPNRDLIGKGMHILKDELPSFWNVFKQSLDCREASGFYDWRDTDGTTLKKYMVMSPIEGTELMVAATISLEEFNNTKAIIEEAGIKYGHEVEGIIKKVGGNLVLMIGAFSLLSLILLLGGGRRASKKLMEYIGEIRRFVKELGNENYNAETPSSPFIAEFEEINCELEKMRDKIVHYQQKLGDNASSAAMGKLSRQIAHDLRNPLSTLGMGVRHLKKYYIGNPDSAVIIGVLETALARINEMIDTILRPKMNYLQDAERFDLVSEAQNILQEFQRKYTEGTRRLSFELKNSSPSLDVICSRANLRRVMENLVQNAVDAVDDVGAISVEISSAGGDSNTAVTISDNGRGIPKEILGNIFSEGFSYGKRGGAGLGLSFCQQVISEHGGTLEAQSEVGRGTRMTFTIPRPPAKSEAGKVSNAVEPKHVLHIAPEKKLLVVDDSVMMLTEWLKLAIRHGIEGEFYNSWGELKQMVDWGNFASMYGLVIVDYLFAQDSTNGIKICEEILSHVENRIPIYVCTSDPSNPILRNFAEEKHIPILPKSHFEELKFWHRIN